MCRQRGVQGVLSGVLEYCFDMTPLIVLISKAWRASSLGGVSRLRALEANTMGILNYLLGVHFMYYVSFDVIGMASVCLCWLQISSTMIVLEISQLGGLVSRRSHHG